MTPHPERVMIAHTWYLVNNNDPTNHVYAILEKL